MAWPSQFGFIATFVVSGLLRLDEPSHTPSVIAYTLEMIGAGIAVISGWLGGELVERLGVGVHEGANVNASNSLTDERARHLPRDRARRPATGGRSL